MSPIKPQPIAAVIARDTTEVPPRGAEIVRVHRDWGEEISFVHKGRVERVTVKAGVGKELIKRLVAERRAALDTPPDRRADLESEIALHEEVVKRLRTELREMV